MSESNVVQLRPAEPKPRACPFCGNTDIELNGGAGDVSMQCEGCLASGPVATISCRDEDDGEINLEAEALELWNGGMLQAQAVPEPPPLTAEQAAIKSRMARAVGEAIRTLHSSSEYEVWSGREHERHTEEWHEWSTDTSERDSSGKLLAKPQRLFLRSDDGACELVEAFTTSQNAGARELEGGLVFSFYLGRGLAKWLHSALGKALALEQAKP